MIPELSRSAFRTIWSGGVESVSYPSSLSTLPELIAQCAHSWLEASSILETATGIELGWDSDADSGSL